MITTKILIQNTIGLHARPVVQLSNVANNYSSDIILSYHGVKANVKNSVRLLALGINSGETIELFINGVDEAPAFEGVMSVFEDINQC